MEKRINNRKNWVGVVVSKSGDKSIMVQVDTYRSHRLYSKKMKNSTKFPTHDPENKAKVGDTVKIEETRPLSKTKKFRLVEIKEKGEK